MRGIHEGIVDRRYSYGLLDTLNAKFQIDLNVTAARAGGLQAAYFGAYFIGPLTWGGWVVRKFGFRWTFITGLVVYGIGALMFWPSAKFSSFGGFCASLFIVGGGLSVCRHATICTTIESLT
jgi:FHS family L-fucose permease-like MFS transporter